MTTVAHACERCKDTGRIPCPFGSDVPAECPCRQPETVQAIDLSAFVRMVERMAAVGPVDGEFGAFERGMAAAYRTVAAQLRQLGVK